MACNDRQLTEAQRQAGFGQQRSGVNRAIRPFSGSQTLENLIDYVNRELGPALRATRDACNDVFLQVADNAPSANPLAFYFSTETGAADPTVGRMRLNQATQNTATVIRVSESNGRLQSVQPWLDVMSGGPTTPLGTLTMVDAINPGRFLRFDLNTMTDQGAYWDLGVTIIESSDANPFVEDEPVVIGFIAGVSAAGSTVPVGSLSPVARDTFVGNIGTTTAPPSANPLASVDSTSIVYDATAHEFQRAALTGEVTAGANANVTTVTRSTGFQTSPWTGIHQFNNELRLGTLHTEASVSGALNITLTAGATRVLITSTADVTLGTISGCADGRVLVLEHERASGTGNLIVTHGTGANAIATPNARAHVITGRGSVLLVGRGTNWKFHGPPRSRGTVQTDAGGGGNNFALDEGTETLFATANATYTGFARPGGNDEGDKFYLQCDAGVTVTLPFNSGSSSSGNRVAGQNAVTYIVGSRGLVEFVYRALLWRIVSLGNEGRLIQMTAYTDTSAGTGTHTFDVRARSYLVQIQAGQGGGGGANSAAAQCAVGGQGGAGHSVWMYVTTVPTSVSYTMGGAGTGGANTGADGTDGTDSVWDGVTVQAGKGGKGSANATFGSGSGALLAMSMGGLGGQSATGSLPSGATIVHVKPGAAGGPGVCTSGTTGWAGGNDTSGTVGNGNGIGGFSTNNSDKAGAGGANARITIWEYS